jgi:hypothetical protein
VGGILQTKCKMRILEMISPPSTIFQLLATCHTIQSLHQVIRTLTYFLLIAKSRSLAEAHFKSLRLFRKYCRYMPFVVNYFGYRRYTTPEHSKLHLANYWRQNNKVRDIHNIDMFVRAGYERLYSM